MGDWLYPVFPDILDDINNEETINAVKEKVKAVCKRFPVYA